MLNPVLINALTSNLSTRFGILDMDPPDRVDIADMKTFEHGIKGHFVRMPFLGGRGVFSSFPGFIRFEHDLDHGDFRLVSESNKRDPFDDSRETRIRSYLINHAPTKRFSRRIRRPRWRWNLDEKERGERTRDTRLVSRLGPAPQYEMPALANISKFRGGHEQIHDEIILSLMFWKQKF